MRSTLLVLWLLLGMGGFAPAVRAQNMPRIGYLYPAGGRQGTSFQMILGGQYLNGATNVCVSGTGVQAVVLDYSKPLSQQQFNLLRQQEQELRARKSAAMPRTRGLAPDMSGRSTNWTAADERMLAEIRARLQKRAPRRNMNPAIAETVTLSVTLAADAEPGERELRIRAATGLSTPFRFWVDSHPEFIKPQAGAATTPRPQTRGNTLTPTAPTETKVLLPVIINGQMLAGGTDRYRFHARRGQQLVFVAKARQLIPYLADAVPGWFQATLTLLDSQGRELAYADHDRFHPDPVLHYEIQRDGEYVLEIRDSLYRGREDFVYRITVGEVPYLTGLFPLGGPTGTVATVQLYGWNLPETSAKVDSRQKSPGTYPVSVLAGKQLANSRPFAVDTLPEMVEQEFNNVPEKAQAITLPIIVNGRIDQPDDVDCYRFEGRAGEAIVVETHARRLGSSVDSVLELTDAAGTLLARNDDHEDKGAGLETHHADAYLRAVLPGDGTYSLSVRDVQQQGGPTFGYRLRVSPPRPGFELRVIPSTINIRAGASVPITVHALRRDGFTNEITIDLKGASKGVRLTGGKVQAGQNEARLTLSASAQAATEPFQISLEGRAIVNGRQIVQPVLPAEDMMQAFAYRHWVVAKDLQVAVSGRASVQAGVKVISPTPVKIPAGGTASLQLATPGKSFANRFQFALSEPQEGIILERAIVTERGMELILSGDDDVVKPGLKGNLIIEILPSNSPSAAKAPPSAKRRSLGALPAVPFEVVIE